jgi:hypothetical protein
MRFKYRARRIDELLFQRLSLWTCAINCDNFLAAS